MDRHLIVVTFLEWLNWNARGFLRVAPERVSWCDSETAAIAFLSSLRLAADLEPADDGFLLADLSTPGRNTETGRFLLPLQGTRFEALSERSARLLSPSANRMEVNLAHAAADIQAAWTDWKAQYRIESADQQARRIWSWAWGQEWPFQIDGHAELLLAKTRQIQAEMKSLTIEHSPRLERFSGTSAEAWFRMILAAERRNLLPEQPEAAWRGTTNSYIAERLKRMSPSLLPNEHTKLDDALRSLPLGEEGMVELLAVAIGEHHSLYLAAGQELDSIALCTDLQALLKYTSREDLAVRKWISTTLLFLGRSLPAGSILALLRLRDLAPGWAQPFMKTATPVQSASIAVAQVDLEGFDASTSHPTITPAGNANSAERTSDDTAGGSDLPNSSPPAEMASDDREISSLTSTGGDVLPSSSASTEENRNPVAASKADDISSAEAQSGTEGLAIGTKPAAPSRKRSKAATKKSSATSSDADGAIATNKQGSLL